MINAEKVTVKNKDWIKVSFYPNPLYEQTMKTVRGALYNPKSKLWAVPYEYKWDFEQKMNDFLIIWKGQEEYMAGGIDENTIPDYPIVPGYSVEYDNNGKIISYTGFKVAPWAKYQVKGFNALVASNFLILADDAGLGKTYQVINAIVAKKKLGQLKRGLIICKASLLYTWRDEISKYSYEKAVVVAGTQKQRCEIHGYLSTHDDWTFMIVSYETFREDIILFKLMVENDKKTLDFCVLDEAQKIKNPTSKIGSLIHKIPFKYKYILTATPLPNTPLEAFNYLKWGNKIQMNWWQFKNNYAIYGGYNNKEIVGYKNISKLKKLIQSNMLRRLKKDKLKELPDVTFKIIKIPMTKPQQKLYNAVKLEIIEEIKELELSNIHMALTKLLRLQQITDSPSLIGAKGESGKFKALDDVLEEIIDEGQQKAIVFSKFRGMVELLKERYKKYNPAVIHGDVDANGMTRKSAEKYLKEKYEDFYSMDINQREKLIQETMTSERQKEVYKFQNDDSCKLFIGCSPACREGLTLTAATHVIFLDLEWAWDYVEQAYSRAHRIGQKNAVTVHFIVCENTIDEHVLNTVNKKKILSGMMLNVSSSIDKTKALAIKEFVEEMLKVA